MAEENTKLETAQDGLQTTQPEGQPNASAVTAEQLRAEAQKLADGMLAKKLKGMPSKEELAAYRKWQDERKTDEQRQAEAATAAQQALQDAEARAAAAEAKALCFGKGVQKDFVEDAMTLAARMVSDEVDMDKALDRVLAKYPAFKGGTATPPPAVTTGARTTGVTMTDAEAYLQAKYGNNAYYKKGM